jgi:hypothetical protein
LQEDRILVRQPSLKCFILFADCLDIGNVEFERFKILATPVFKELLTAGPRLRLDLDFPTPESRKCKEARRKFADDYSEIYKDLVPLFDEISELGDDSFFYGGLKGKEFNTYGPPVEIGVVQPFPVTPAASSEWEARAAFIDHEDFNGDVIFTETLNQREVELMHLSGGLCVPKSEHTLLEKLVEEYLLRKPVLVAGLRYVFSNIVKVLIRAIWPGHSHKVFTDPRAALKTFGARPAFHEVRVAIASKYIHILWQQGRKRLKSQLEEIEESGPETSKTKKGQKTMAKTKEAKKGATKQKKAGEPKTDLKNPKSPKDWEHIIKDVLERLRTAAGQHHAIAVGFGAVWFKDYYTTGTKPNNNLSDGGGAIRFFDRVQNPKKKSHQTVSSPSSSASEEDDDSGDKIPSPPPAKKKKRLLRGKK